MKGIISVLLSLTAITFSASAITVDLTGNVDARVRDVDGTPFTDFTPTLNEVYLGSDGFRTNTILEFDLSFVPVGETIDSIFLTVTEILAANMMFVNGYAGNGSLEVADAFENANSLGIFAIAVGDNGPFSLSTAYVNGLLMANTSHLGLNIGVQNPQDLDVPSQINFPDFSVQFNTGPAQTPDSGSTLGILVLSLVSLGLARRKTNLV